MVSFVKRALPAVLLLSLAIRVALAFVSTGFEHPNEFSRTLEPIAERMGFSARLPWEWEKGLLSPIPAAIEGAVVESAERLLGTPPHASAKVLRVERAVLSMLPVLASVTLLHAAGTPLPWVLGAAAYLGLWPEWLFHSVRLMDYGWEAALFALAVLLLFFRGAGRGSALLAGAALSLAFFFRPQGGLALLSLSLLLVLDSARRRLLLPLMLGSVASFVAFGAIERGLTGKEFLSPFFAYWRFNWTEGGAHAVYGADPWHRYLSESVKAFGAIPFLALLVGAVSSPRSRNLLFLFGIPFLAHSFVSHKEGRFLLGFAWALVPAGIAGLASLRIPGRTARGLLAFLAISAGLQAHRDLPKLLLRRDLPEQFTLLGRALPSQGRVLVVGDGDFLPGGFFLRTKLPLSFHPTPPADVSESVLLRLDTAGRWSAEFFPGRAGSSKE